MAGKRLAGAARIHRPSAVNAANGEKSHEEGQPGSPCTGAIGGQRTKCSRCRRISAKRRCCRVRQWGTLTGNSSITTYESCALLAGLLHVDFAHSLSLTLGFNVLADRVGELLRLADARKDHAGGRL